MAQVDQHTCVSDWKKQFNWEIIPVQLHTACLLVQVGMGLSPFTIMYI